MYLQNSRVHALVAGGISWASQLHMLCTSFIW